MSPPRASHLSPLWPPLLRPPLRLPDRYFVTTNVTYIITRRYTGVSGPGGRLHRTQEALAKLVKDTAS
eukprot:747682-Hanusia_phi.AAC.4